MVAVTDGLTSRGYFKGTTWQGQVGMQRCRRHPEAESGVLALLFHSCGSSVCQLPLLIARYGLHGS
jgi:hypothetical protein